MTYPSNSESIAHDQIVSYVRRIESIEDEKKALNDDLSEIYKEARGNGFDVKVLRKVIADRRKDAADRAEFETIYELYWNAVHGLAHAHVENIEEFGADAFGVARVMRYGAEQGEVLDTSSRPAADTSPVPGRQPSLAGAEGEEDRQQIPAQDSSGTNADKPKAALPASVEAIADGEGGVHHPNAADEAEPPKVEASSATLEPVTDYIVFYDADADGRCLDPDLCGSNSRLAICDKCKAAAGHPVEAAA